MEKKYPIEDIATSAPGFDDLVRIIEKNFKAGLFQSKAFTPYEVDAEWEKFKFRNHLYQDEKHYFPPLPEPILNDEDVKDLDIKDGGLKIAEINPVWVSAGNRIPGHDGIVHLKIDGLNRIGNFYDRNNARGLYVNGPEPYLLGEDKFNGIFWLDESKE